jgi:choline dehydrogenase-like flavoprotein
MFMLSADVIIVGAGTAGCVLASELSSNPSRSVLLLEAGPDYPDLSALPDALKYVRKISRKHDWGLKSEPLRALGGKTLLIPRGKVVGGCSAVNMGVVSRPPATDFDRWRDLGCTSWDWDAVFPILKQIEDDEQFGPPLHSKGGQVRVSRAPRSEWVPVQRGFFDSCLGLGFNSVDDLNAGSDIGVGPCPVSDRNGYRLSAARSHLAPVRMRRNLTILPNVVVDKVLVARGKATGVRYIDSAGVPAEAWASHKIVLSGGTVGSPCILWRSGIGPVNELKALGIEPLLDLAGVGSNLQDHPAAILAFLLKPGVARKNDPMFQVLLKAATNRRKEEFDLHILPRSSSSTYPNLPHGRLAFLIVVSYLTPESRGSLRVASKDPQINPHITLGYFSQPADAESLVEGIRIAREIVGQKPLSSLVDHEVKPGTTVRNTALALRPELPHLVTTYHHLVGTCRMGSPYDKAAVVDEQFRVLGIEGLMVADASIMPVIPRANTNLTTIMLAQRCATATFTS